MKEMTPFVLLAVAAVPEVVPCNFYERSRIIELVIVDCWVHTVVVITAVVLELALEEPFPLAVAVAPTPPVVAEDGLGVASSLQLLAADFTSVP